MTRSIVVAALLVGAYGCTDARFIRDGNRDSGTDADGAATDSMVGPVCNLRRPPDRPIDMDTTDTTVTFALIETEIDMSGTWQTNGYSLDDHCTEAPDFERECDTPSERLIEDGLDGIDNVFADRIVGQLKSFYGDLSPDLQAEQDRGLFAVVAHVTGWNGTPNDQNVTVAFAQTACVSPPGAGPCDPATATPLDWAQVNDLYADAALFDGSIDMPMAVDDGAYVVDGLLVSRPSGTLDIRFQLDDANANSVRIQAADVYFTGQIAADGSRLDNALIIGRWGTDEIMDTVDEVLGQCASDVAFLPVAMVVRSVLADTADVRLPVGSGGAGVQCNAVSYGLSATGYRSNLAGLQTALPAPNPCM